MRSKNEYSWKLETRIKEFAGSVVQFYCDLPDSDAVQMLDKQVLVSGTAVGSCYGEAVRSGSPVEFFSCLERGLNELRETEYWLGLLSRSGAMPLNVTGQLVNEAQNLAGIFSDSLLVMSRHVA